MRVKARVFFCFYFPRCSVRFDFSLVMADVLNIVLGTLREPPRQPLAREGLLVLGCSEGLTAKALIALTGKDISDELVQGSGLVDHHLFEVNGVELAVMVLNRVNMLPLVKVNLP